MATAATTVGDHLREWRRRRRMSQLDLAVDAEISTRHLSFVESGRSQPSARCAAPGRAARRALRDRNCCSVSAGFAPVFAERPIGDPALARGAQGNRAGAQRSRALSGARRRPPLDAGERTKRCAPLLAGADPALLKPPVNVLRLSLHPPGLAPRIANLAEWRAHLLERLRSRSRFPPTRCWSRCSTSCVPCRRQPPRRPPPAPNPDYAGVVIPLQLVTEAGVLSFLSTTTVFGTPRRRHAVGDRARILLPGRPRHRRRAAAESQQA